MRNLLANDAANTAQVQQLWLAFVQTAHLDWVLDMPLVQAAGLAPQVLTPEKLDTIDAALATAAAAAGTCL